MVNDTHTNNRLQAHAKLLRYAGRQALVMLNRADDGALTIIVQVWCAAEDSQLRMEFAVDNEDDFDIAASFINMTDEALAKSLDALGFGDVLRGLEAQ